MKFLKPLAIGLLLVAAQLTAMGAEVAILSNGRSIRHDRREQIGENTRLFIDGGYIDVPTSSIASYEKEELVIAPPQPVAAPQPVASAPSVPEVKPIPVAAASPLDINQVVRDASNKRSIDPDFVNSVIKAESNFHPHAISPKGAQGLMQIMPGTANKLGLRDAFDPRANVEAGTAYLSELLTLYNNDPIKALAAYNAGPQRVQQYHGVPPYRETRAYISRIVRDFNAKKLAQMKAAGQPLPALKPADSKKNTKKTAAKPAPQQASLTNTHSPS
jgi:soluble lytic murein transglycosylase-like protein